MKNLIRRLVSWLNQYTKPEQDELVMALVLHTASLALLKDQYVEFAAIKGTCGTFKLTGNSLPSFNYTVFEKKIMEFISVTVEVSRPDRIDFKSVIKSTDEKTNGREVETIDRYKAPFFKLAHHLFNYFPFPMEGGRKETKKEAS